MKILVTGADGQLGRALQKVLPENETVFTTRKDLDITNKKQVVQQIASVRPDFVIHTAAYTDVDGCEKNPKLANNINFEGTKNITKACEKVGATLIYISTDFVFDGKKKTPYKENDATHPLQVYGKSKLAGEKEVQKLPKYYIIRTSWLFGPTSREASRGKSNFVQTILALAKKHVEIKVVSDQIGCPTYAKDLSKEIKKLIYDIRNKKYESKILHVTNSGETSWADFAKEIIKQKKLNTKIIPITTAQRQKIRPDSAPRPKYSVLKPSVKMRNWKEALRDYLNSF